MDIGINRRGRRALAAIAPLVLSPALHAVEYEIGEGKLKISGAAYLGVAVRTQDPDRELLPNVNSARVGIVGGAVSQTAGRNQDDGNLNYKRGDRVAEVAKAYLTLDYKWRDYGIVASGKAWYDYATARLGVPWGNSVNGYAAGEPLSDAGAMRLSKFNGAVIDNLYGHGRNRLGDVTVDWIVGNQKLDWGNRYYVFGGLRDLNPLDLSAAFRPAVDRDQETRIAFPALFARVALPGDETSVEGFYQLRFRSNAPNECGTFFAQLDFVSEGCTKVFLAQNLSDRTLLANNNYIKRAETVDPSDSGQGGIALKQKVAKWNTEFGLYAAQFHSRSSFYSVIKSSRSGAPYVAGDADNRNPKYFTEYPEDIRMYGLTFDSKFRGGAVFGEFSYRPNQPLQYNSQDLIAAFTSTTAPTPLRARANAAALGSVFSGWERHDVMQLQLGASATVPQVLGAAALNVGGEVIFKRIPGLPDQSVTRFGRPDVFGQGPVNGVCPLANPVSCSNDGYVSKNAYGYRLRASLRYPNALPGIDLIPSLFFGHDVSGWSNDGGIVEGRKLAILALTANFKDGLTAGVSWQPTWGGTYNNMRDRSTAQAYVGYKF